MSATATSGQQAASRRGSKAQAGPAKRGARKASAPRSSSGKSAGKTKAVKAKSTKQLSSASRRRSSSVKGARSQPRQQQAKKHERRSSSSASAAPKRSASAAKRKQLKQRPVSSSSKAPRGVEASAGDAHPAPVVLVPNDSPHSRCSLSWQPDPTNPKRVQAEVKTSDFNLDNKDHVGLFVEMIRSAASKPTFTFAAWEALRPQIHALQPRAVNGKKPVFAAFAGFHRILAAFDSVAKKASHRRRKTGERRRLGFTLAHRVSDAFVKFANDNGADWQVGDFHARAKCNTLLFGHVRIADLRSGGKIKVSPALEPLLDPDVDPITTDPATGDKFVPDRLLQTLLTRHHGPNLTAPSSCGQPPKDLEDSSPLPAALIRKGGSGTGGSGHQERHAWRQLTRVSRSFATQVAKWDPTQPHSRFVGLNAMISYCKERGLVVEPAPLSEPRVCRFKLDDVLRQLHQEADLEIKADDVNYGELRRLVAKHIAAQPSGESDCPPFDQIPRDNDAVPSKTSGRASRAQAMAVDDTQDEKEEESEQEEPQGRRRRHK